MLQTRSAVPLLRSSLPQPWQLHALLRLPPELRQIAVRAFSSSAPVLASQGVSGKEPNRGDLRTSRTRPMSRREYRRLHGNPSNVSTARAAEESSAEVEDHGSSAARSKMPSQPVYRQIIKGNTRTLDQNLGIRGVAVRDWGEDQEEDELVRAFNTAVDETARQSIRDRMSLLKTARKWTRDASRMTRRSSRHQWSSFSKPFEQQHDPTAGFADAVSGSPASTRTNHGPNINVQRANKFLTPNAVATLIKLEEIRKDLDPEKDKDELQKIDAQLRRVKLSLYHSGEELHQYRSAEELVEYDRISKELGKEGVTRKEEIALKAERKRLNVAADRRRVATERDRALEAKFREELFSKHPPMFIVHAKGGILTLEEQESLDKIEAALEADQASSHPDAHYVSRLRKKHAILLRTAYLRSAVLRDDPHTLRKNRHGTQPRLAQLKKALLGSPDSVANAPEIKAQLKELEDSLRHSLKAALPSPGPKVSQRTATEAALKQLAINFRRADTRAINTTETAEVDTEVEDVQHAVAATTAPPTVASVDTELPASSPEPRPAEAPALATEPAVATESVPSSLVARPEDLSIFTELRGQMQELNSLLKLLVSQQAATQSSSTSSNALSEVIEKASGTMNALSGAGTTHGIEATGRYTNLNRSAADENDAANNFSDLPHEVESEPAIVSQEDQAQDSVPSQVASAATDQTNAPANANSAVSEAAVESASGLEELSSLYEQLFPEEAAQSQKTDDNRKPVPRLSLPQDSTSVTQDRQLATPEQLVTNFDEEVEHWKSVLILTGASKSLTEDDFRRAIPRGKHFQEWTKSAYERVIPVRDFWTLEPTGDYYIVFNHHKKADAFLAHVKRVYNLSKSHTPTSLLSDLPPAPSGLLRDGADDEAELVRNFTLAAPSMSLNLQRAEKGIKAEVLKRGAYPQVLAGNLTPETPQVVLDLQGGVMPNWFQIRDAIARDGIRRSLPWNLISGDLAIRRLVMERPSSQADLEADYETALDDGANELVARDNLADIGSGYDSDATMLARERLERGEQGQRWVVAFREREEAQRFVRGWHMRAFPWTEAEFRVHRTYQRRTRMKVEMLW